MNKNKAIVSVTVGLICLILAFVMTIQLKTVNETDITSIENMREDELKEQIELWKTKYEETSKKVDENKTKIQEYKEKATNSQEASNLLEEELEQMNMNLGKTDVEGQGIIITLKDGTEAIESVDIIKLINELKLAEAEAISINNERIINLTDIADVSSYIVINGNRLSSPFEVKVIGNQQYLSSGLTAKGGFVDKMTANGKKVNIENEKNIKIAKYDKELKLKTIKID